MKEITKISGLNLRQDATDLPDYDATFCVNMDVGRSPGTLILRRGKENLTGLQITDNLTLRTIYKCNGFRYQVAGTRIYNNLHPIAPDKTLSDNLRTSFIDFQPVQDIFIWAFIADENIMLKTEGVHLYNWGIDVLPTPEPKVVNQTGKDPSDTIEAGTYGIAVTQLRFTS